MKIEETPINSDNKSPSVFVVTSYLYGKRNNHSYVVGVYDNKDAALLSADKEEYLRYNKYICEVYEMTLNENIWKRRCRAIKGLG